MKKFKIFEWSKTKCHPYDFKPYYGCKGFLKIDTFNLDVITLGHNLALSLVRFSDSSNLFLKIHLVPMVGLSWGLGIRCQTWLYSNWLSSSCIASNQYESPSASRMFLGSICEINAKWPQISWSLERVVTPLNTSPIIRSLGWFVAYLQSFGRAVLAPL